MTDAHLPVPADELASAYLDGALGDEARRQVEADPALLAEVSALRAVRAAVARPVEVDPARRAEAIARALAAMPLGTAATPRTARRRRELRWLVPIGGAVAAAAAVGAFVLVVGNDDPAPTAIATTTAPGDEARAADGFGEADTSADAAEAAAPPAGGADLGQETTASAGLGDLTTLDDLAEAARQVPAGVPATCPPGVAGAAFVGPARWQGVAVEVFATATEAIAVDATTCARLATAPLP